MAKNVKINSVIYAEVPQVSISLAEGEGSAVFYDTSGATASSGDILNGKSVFLGSGSVTGTMTDNGAVSGSIAKADGAPIPSRSASIMAAALCVSAKKNRPSSSAATSSPG